MALGLAQPLKEMSTRNLPGGKGHSAFKADNLTAIYQLIVWKMWKPQYLKVPRPLIYLFILFTYSP
jgi:hypothetical protein